MKKFLGLFWQQFLYIWTAAALLRNNSSKVAALPHGYDINLCS